MFRQCSMDFAIEMFNKLVKHILMYGSEMWAPMFRPRTIRRSSAMEYARMKTANMLPQERVMIKFMRLMLQAPTNTA